MPGTTGGKKPRGRKSRMISSMLRPASQRSQPVSASNPRMRLSRSVSNVMPDESKAASPYARPMPRASTGFPAREAMASCRSRLDSARTQSPEMR